ncbi:hypothetical protein [Halococcus sp. PRR34]|uniref:hypothetical protein n=1 Tax=Halococcus sp. PRR34 TaxID=3020830 RepID=UPI0023623F51|nr:hypothetical protein [Halococcus sp. PRR34]
MSEHELRKTGTADYVQTMSYSEEHGCVFESGPLNLVENVAGPEVKCSCGETFEGFQGARRHIEEERGIRA